MDIAVWLTGLGLERYKEAFEQNEIDFAILPRLTADDLTKRPMNRYHTLVTPDPTFGYWTYT